MPQMSLTPGVIHLHLLPFDPFPQWPDSSGDKRVTGQWPNDLANRSCGECGAGEAVR